MHPAPMHPDRCIQTDASAPSQGASSGALHGPVQRAVHGIVNFENTMIFSRDYVGYLARQTVKSLQAAKMIETGKPALVEERVGAAMIDELSLEDRINDEVRIILEAIQEDMLKGGVSYPEMFKKIKQKLVAQYKAVL